MENNSQKIETIKNWLGTGSINLFGLPMSGKDTVGIRLAELLGAKFLSSGLIIRAREEETGKDYTKKGQLAPTDVFFDLVLPYFSREDLKPFPLILSSVGRWSGIVEIATSEVANQTAMDSDDEVAGAVVVERCVEFKVVPAGHDVPLGVGGVVIDELQVVVGNEVGAAAEGGFVRMAHVYFHVAGVCVCCA